MGTTSYRVGGIDLRSEIPLAAALAPHGATTAVEIRYGNVPRELRECRVRKLLCEAAPREFLLRIPNIARYWVREGEQIVVEAAPGAAVTDVAAYLLSYAFAALCHQRRVLVLQATAVAVDGYAVVLLGPSGCGKSTLAAALLARGYAICGDGICVIDTAAEQVRVQPVVNGLGLWSDTIEHFGWSDKRASRLICDLDKHLLDAEMQSVALPIGCACLLRTSQPPQPVVSGEQLRAGRAIAAVSEQTCLPFLIDALGGRAWNFQQSAKMLERAALYNLSCHWRLGSVCEAARFIERLVSHESSDAASRGLAC